MKNHRCPGVLKNKTPIRTGDKDGVQLGIDEWCLYNMEFDFDNSDEWYMMFITVIEYCPYCGIKLEVNK